MSILSSYDGAIPFAAWIKGYFSQHKKHGSRDRKIISHLCYSYFRLGHAFAGREVEERLLIGQLLCSQQPTSVLQELRPQWVPWVERPVEEKVTLLNAQGQIQAIFPFQGQLSKAIDADSFSASFLIQPDVFLRIRPGKKARVLQKLQAAGIPFHPLGESALRLPVNAKADEVLQMDNEVVVQDLSSQQVMTTLVQQPLKEHFLTIWDCCAASGGKSILACDLLQNVQVTATDIRESILINLRKRFERAGIRNYRSFISDVSEPHFRMQTRGFDVIICDAPCSGSGTWGRTPEQLTFFREEKIDYYADLQERISVNASKYVNKDGYFLYITCSVFEKENDGVVAFLQKNSYLQLISANYYKGYHQKADTLFTALFKRQQ